MVLLFYLVLIFVATKTFRWGGKKLASKDKEKENLPNIMTVIGLLVGAIVSFILVTYLNVSLVISQVKVFSQPFQRQLNKPRVILQQFLVAGDDAERLREPSSVSVKPHDDRGRKRAQPALALLHTPNNVIKWFVVCNQTTTDSDRVNKIVAATDDV